MGSPDGKYQFEQPEKTMKEPENFENVQGR
jgi:hypothetical protein